MPDVSIKYNVEEHSEIPLPATTSAARMSLSQRGRLSENYGFRDKAASRKLDMRKKCAWESFYFREIRNEAG